MDCGGGRTSPEQSRDVDLISTLSCRVSKEPASIFRLLIHCQGHVEILIETVSECYSADETCIWVVIHSVVDIAGEAYVSGYTDSEWSRPFL